LRPVVRIEISFLSGVTIWYQLHPEGSERNRWRPKRLFLTVPISRHSPSDTRVEIEKALDTRPMTVSELAGHLGLAKSTVHEHLSMLADRGMVTVDEDRKWRRYSLTERMRRLLRPGTSHRISILLGTSLVTLTLGGVLLAAYFCGYTVHGSSTHRDPLLLFAGEVFLFVTFAL